MALDSNACFDETPAIEIGGDHVEPHFGKQALLTHESSHDTFDNDKHKNWLVNGAGIGIYAHGRIHQQSGNVVYVSDLIHKRGFVVTDDLLLMEEQAGLSFGEPLSTNSRLGSLKALAVLPAMGTANGEGDLIAYFQNGVVSFNTGEVPRETRYDGDGTRIQAGWDTKRLVNHMLNVISAVGRYAVATLTRDHLFRSVKGLHFLKVILGEGTFNSENVNKISMDVEPILEQDPSEFLNGCSVGFWVFGDRMFSTTGLVCDNAISATPYGRGFVSWNQAVTFTEDRTPRALWEGLWVVDFGIAGVHRFVDVGDFPTSTSFGFVCSDRDKKIYIASIDKDLDHDIRDDVAIPIEWSFETAQFAPAGLSSKAIVSDCVIELVASRASQKMRVLVRTDVSGEWTLWRSFSPADKVKVDSQRILFTESLGRPPASCREATWFQVRVEGVGPVEIRLVDMDFSASTVKAGRAQAYVVSTAEKDFFEINTSPTETRWQ